MRHTYKLLKEEMRNLYRFVISVYPLHVLQWYRIACLIISDDESKNTASLLRL